MPEFRFRNVMNVSPSDVQDYDAFALRVVAVAYPGGTWRAYRGYSHWSDERIAENGDEILKEAAELLFYPMKHSGRYYG